MKAFLKCFLSLCVLASVLLLSCKKEMNPVPNDPGDLTSKSVSTEKLNRRAVVHAGSSIQSAIDAAESNTIIIIEPGVYTEAVVINKPGMQLVGLGRGVILKNPGAVENGITVNDLGDGF